MAVQWMDGFDHYGSGNNGLANMLAGAWAAAPSNGTIGTPSWGARTGPFALNGGQNTRRVLTTPSNRVFLSCGFSVDHLPPSDFLYSICSFNDGSNVVMAKLWLQSTGVIALANAAGTVLAQTQGPVIVSRNWHFLEMLFDKTSGLFTLRVDDATGTGTPVIAATGLTFASACAQVGIMDQSTGAVISFSWMDDLMVRDDSGSVNNGWLGDRRVTTLFANADTTPAGWVPSYYHKFGTGILRLGYLIAGNPALNNPNAYISAAASSSLDIGNADFTLETEIRFDQLPTAGNYQTIFSRWDATNNRRSYRLSFGSAAFNNGCLQFDTSTDGTNTTVQTPILYPWTPATNTWYHLALVRAAGQLLLFVDGVQLGLPITDSRTYFSGGTEPFVIGAETTGITLIPNSQLAGRLDETRFTNGVGRYTSTFTPPNAAFPRGVSDPNWASVVLLMGYDTALTDESSFARTITASGNANFFLPGDGPAIGVYSTVNKATPDDGSFIAAYYGIATNILTMTTNPANGNTITLGTKDGTTPAVYTFKTMITSAFDVVIAAGNPQLTLQNFLNAVNTGPGAGTAYGTGTTANFNVNAVNLPIGQIQVFANIAGAGGNSIVSTATGTAAVWGSTTLLGGSAFPGPTAFKLQRPPNTTTIISALQVDIRALKTDAGLAAFQPSLVGGAGAKTDGAIHPLTTSVSYYADVFQSDPDTGGPISPTTILNGKVQINRTT